MTSLSQAPAYKIKNLEKGILGLVGKTPIIEIKRLNPNPNVKILAKLEGQNPTGSLKDRIALCMIEAAEKRGELTKDKVILEATSGNTGISLAWIAKIKGYKFEAVIPDNVTKERIELIKAFGGKVTFSDGQKGTNGAIEKAQRIGARNLDKYYLPNQYANQNNVKAHYRTTAKEILEAVGKVDFFIAGLGTGGTLMGVSKKLKEVNPKTKVIAVQPYPKGGLAGLRNMAEGFIPPIVDFSLLDESVVVKDKNAFEATKQLLKKEGIFAGVSSGAVLYEAIKVAKKINRGTIVTVFPDGGWKYLSQKVWTLDAIQLSEEYEGPLW